MIPRHTLKSEIQLEELSINIDIQLDFKLAWNIDKYINIKDSTLQSKNCPQCHECFIL